MVKARSYGVDVASYQPATLSYSGSSFAIIKLTEGSSYINPKARTQISSTKAHGMLPMGYFYAHFSSNSSVAKTEAKYATQVADNLGLQKGSYIAIDWENGSGNSIYGGLDSNTNAIVEAMAFIKSAGYKPLLYSGAYALRNNVRTSTVVKQFGDCLWVAAYPLGNGIASSSPNFGYFPSMNGVAIWQFTDNWKGLGVDGNINLLPLENGSGSSSASSGKSKEREPIHPAVKWDIEGVVIVDNASGAYIYKDKDLKERYSDKPIKQDTVYELKGAEQGAVKIGEGQYFDGRAVLVKLNPIAHDDYKSGRVKVMLDHTHALASPDADAEKVASLEKGKVYNFVGRKERFFKLKDKINGKEVWVTGNRTYVLL